MKPVDNCPMSHDLRHRVNVEPELAKASKVLFMVERCYVQEAEKIRYI